MKRRNTDDDESSSKSGNSAKYLFSHYDSEVMEQLQELQEISFANSHELVQHCNDFLEFYLKQPRWLRLHSNTRVKCNECVFSWTLQSETFNDEESVHYKIGNCFSLVHQHRQIESSILIKPINNIDIICQTDTAIENEDNVSIHFDEQSVNKYNENNSISSNSGKKINKSLN